MAQPKRIDVMVDVDVSRVRRKVKAVIREAQDANRELAQLQERLGTLGGRLQALGIDLVIGDEDE